MAQYRRNDEVKEYSEKVVQIRRVTKVVKGGKKMSFRALVIVGNGKGKVGIGLGKANEVASAIRKAVEDGKKNLITIQINEGTIAHDCEGRFSASKTVVKTAPSGTGVIAGGSVRTVLEMAGVKNIVAKSIGSSNAINVARATIDALLQLKEIEAPQ
ncbi:MAG: 30S ribosomal protein S5 [Candidatus Margulisiibacteriota bacterium]